MKTSSGLAVAVVAIGVPGPLAIRSISEIAGNFVPGVIAKEEIAL